MAHEGGSGWQQSQAGKTVGKGWTVARQACIPPAAGAHMTMRAEGTEWANAPSRLSVGLASPP